MPRSRPKPSPSAAACGRSCSASAATINVARTPSRPCRRASCQAESSTGLRATSPPPAPAGLDQLGLRIRVDQRADERLRLLLEEPGGTPGGVALDHTALGHGNCL